ncbi:MAG: PorT family protein [Tannerellaceae bacterium]|nr:PorT family protein [Tannerellaceae bacterium]
MSDNKEADKSLDRFSEYMQKRLANHRMPIDDDCWTEVEAKLRKRPGSYLWKIGLGMVAASLLALVFFRVSISVDPGPEPIESSALVQEISPALDTLASEFEDEFEDVNREVNKVYQVYQGGELEPELEPELEVEQVEEVMEEEVAPEAEAEDKGVEQSARPYRTWTERKPLPAKKKESKWLIAAAFGSGGGYAPGNPGGGRDMVYDSEKATSMGDGLYAGSSIVPPDYEYLIPGDFSDVTYSIPLSFGLTFRKKLSKRMAIESGLVYTYLLTRFERPAANRYSARLGLHYLGIPLKLVTYLWNDPQWTVYGTAGVMGEKGLRSVFTQKRYVQDGILTTTVSSPIQPLQWSLNASLGASYRFYKEWSLYAEPRLAYYFESDQPLSTRTEHPLSFELGIGLRYAF